ncbi:MAG: hypothetical protein JWO06_737 [Bacteroidota bacterium]|nr:hypothetical protein [Bacteroidota bacterium]
MNLRRRKNSSKPKIVERFPQFKMKSCWNGFCEYMIFNLKLNAMMKSKGGFLLLLDIIPSP